MQKPWFKAKEQGWGWYPATWQAWIVMLIFVGALVWNFFRINATVQSPNDLLVPFVLETIGMGVILLIVAWLTGEKASSRSGDKK